MNLTIEEIRNSIRRAQEINNLAIAKQTEAFGPDKLIEQWLPETNDPQTFHVNDNKAHVKEVWELLQESIP